MADNLGFSNVGCFGGEIHTPNINYLAKNGVRFTQFYNTSSCYNTRASLLKGFYNHDAGIGEMTDAQSTKQDQLNWQNHKAKQTKENNIFPKPCKE